MKKLIGDSHMDNTFLFSKDHLVILLVFATFLYFAPRLTKNLLPYSYLVEKIICALLLLEIILEQATLFSMNNYNVFDSLPIGIGSFTSYLCISILFFKQYQLFNIFFSWSLVSSIGDLIFFKNMGCRFPNFIYFLYIFSKFLIIYANVYMCEVRKFKVSNSAIKDNLIMCFIYFSFIFLLNKFSYAHYYYSFSTYSLFSILIFIFATTVLYIPYICSNNKDKIKFIKKRSK